MNSDIQKQTQTPKLREKIELPVEPQEKDFPPLKHTWKLDSRGEIDDFAYEAGDYHNGPRCTLCDFAECGHCEEDVYEDTSCAYEQALKEYYNKRGKILSHNSFVEKAEDVAELLEAYAGSTQFDEYEGQRFVDDIVRVFYSAWLKEDEGV